MILQGTGTSLVETHGLSRIFVILVAQIEDRERRADHHLAAVILLLHSIRERSGFFGSSRMLGSLELMADESDGFRLHWRNTRDSWVDVVRTKDGQIHVTSNVSDAEGRWQFDETFVPNELTILAYDQVVDHLLLN